MDDWISDLLIFSAGVAGGILITSIKPYFETARKRRTALVAARARMLADIKEKHDEEILDEALRTTEAIRGELDKSLETLRRTLNVVSPMAAEPENHQGRPLVHLSEPVKPS